jgi:hypothetical protein
MDNQEEAWRSEFERLGEQQVQMNIAQGAIYSDERKRRAAFQWLWEKARKRSGVRKEKAHWQAQWTFYLAIGAAAIAIIGVIVGWLH